MRQGKILHGSDKMAGMEGILAATWLEKDYAPSNVHIPDFASCATQTT